MSIYNDVYEGDPAQLFDVPDDEQLDDDPPREVEPADLSDVDDSGPVVVFGTD